MNLSLKIYTIIYSLQWRLHRILVRQRATGVTGVFLLRGPITDPLAHRLTHSGLQCRDRSYKNARDIEEGTELTSFRARAEGAEVNAALSRESCHCSCVKPLPNWQTEKGIKYNLFHCGDLRPHPTKFMCQARATSSGFPS